MTPPGEHVRLARSLLKAVIVLAFAAGALGGAAALGSTLFEEPPRDAAEFAQRIEAASERHEREGAPRTAEEKRFVRRVNALCARYDARTDALAGRKPAAILDGILRERQAFVERFRVLDAPGRYAKPAQRLLAVEAEVQPALRDVAEALRRGAAEPPPALKRKLDRLDAGYDVLLRDLDARKCTTEWADRH
jgi:hypothetical protein